MTRNDIIKLTCNALDIDLKGLQEIYHEVDPEVGYEDVADLMKNEGEPGFIYCSDAGLSLFLEGLIIKRRGGRRENATAVSETETELSNNDVLKKLRIALALQDDEMREIFSMGGKEFSRSELTPYFRKEGHRNFRRCSDKMLRLFLKGLALWREEQK